MFEATALNRRSYRNQSLVRVGFLAMTVVLIVPVLLVLGLLIVKGGPALSWGFLFTRPTNGMTAGGILPALIGTVWLVAVALLASAVFGGLHLLFHATHAGGIAGVDWYASLGTLIAGVAVPVALAALDRPPRGAAAGS